MIACCPKIPEHQECRDYKSLVRNYITWNNDSDHILYIMLIRVQDICRVPMENIHNLLKGWEDICYVRLLTLQPDHYSVNVASLSVLYK